MDRALQILWVVAHEPGLGRQQIDCVLLQHLTLLKNNDNDCLREQYVRKCVDNIKAKQLVYPSVNYLYQLCISLPNGSRKMTLNDWNQRHELVLVLVTSIKEHQRDCYAQFGQHLSDISSLDGNYKHEEFLRLHLDLIHYILRNADLYLTKIRVLEMWESLIADDSSTETDRDAFFNWLVRSYDDLEDKTVTELFHNHFLRLDVAKVTPSGFVCFKYIFEQKMASLEILASHLPVDSLGQLVRLVAVQWKAVKCDSDNWAKLVELAGLVAMDRALQILWVVAHEPGLGRQQIDCVLLQHLTLLKNNDNDCLREQYVRKCVDNIKAKQLVYPSVNYLYQLCISLPNGSRKMTLNDWNQRHELVLVLVTSIKEHQRDCYAQFGQHLSDISSLDGNYKHEEFLQLHLDLIHYILRNAELYLTKIRVLEMWESLIADDSSTETDRDAFFNWLARSYDNLDDKTVTELFHNHFLQLDVAKVTTSGFNCFENIFERINLSAGNLRIEHPNDFCRPTVDKLDLIGSSYLWSLYLRSERPAVFRGAHDCLVNCYYPCDGEQVLLTDAELSDRHRRFLSGCLGHLSDTRGAGSTPALNRDTTNRSSRDELLELRRRVNDSEMALEKALAEADLLRASNARLEETLRQERQERSNGSPHRQNSGLKRRLTDDGEGAPGGAEESERRPGVTQGPAPLVKAEPESNFG